MICSRVNEETFLDDLPGNKSLTVGLNMTTDDTRITPCVDLDQVALVLTSNRVNQPVSNYATDFRVNTVDEDPNKFFYVTKNIKLENPGTSIQVYLDAYLAELFLTSDVSIRLELRNWKTLSLFHSQELIISNQMVQFST